MSDDGTQESLFDRLGGEGSIKNVVNDFYERVLADADLAPYFVDVDMKSLRQHQFEMISAATGGPLQYTGREMGSAHADLGIAPEHFDRVVMHLVASLGAAGVAEGDIADVAAALGPLKPDVVSV